MEGADPVSPRPNIVILSPSSDGSTVWPVDVDRIAKVMWKVDSMIPIDSHKIYLSYEGNGWEEIIGHISLENNNMFVFHWTIPKDFKPVGSYRLKIEGWNKNWLVAEAISSSFLIQAPYVDYGPVASFVIDAPDQIAPGLDFSLTVTAKNKNSDTIVDYDSPVYIYCGTTPGLPTICNGCTIGSGSTTGIWDNGTVTHYGFSECFLWFSFNTTYYISVGTNSIVPDLSDCYPEFVGVLYVYNCIYIDIPTSSTGWIAGHTEGIVINAGGVETPATLTFYYSDDDGNSWNVIESVACGNQPQTYNWEIPVELSNLDTASFKVKAVSFNEEEVAIATGISDAFIINSV